MDIITKYVQYYYVIALDQLLINHIYITVTLFHSANEHTIIIQYMNILYLSGSATDHYPENIDHIIVNPRKCTRIEGKL
jgi:hypothetical protein